MGWPFYKAHFVLYLSMAAMSCEQHFVWRKSSFKIFKMTLFLQWKFPHATDTSSRAAPTKPARLDQSQAHFSERVLRERCEAKKAFRMEARLFSSSNRSVDSFALDYCMFIELLLIKIFDFRTRKMETFKSSFTTTCSIYSAASSTPILAPSYWTWSAYRVRLSRPSSFSCL